ncbi:MAG: SemiSWEET family sugar transporter [Actinomycetes bacterium]
MDAVMLVGWLAAVVGTVLGIPQAYRLIRTRNVEGVAVSAWQVMLALNVAWLVHGVRIAQANMVVVNALGLLSTVTILIVLSRELPRSLPRILLPGLAVAAAMISVNFLLGGAVYGLFAAIPAVLGQLGQTAELVRAERVEGVSKVFLTMSFTNFALWTLWGFLAGDQAAFIASLATGAVALLNVAWLGLRLSGLGPKRFLVPAFS